MDSRQDSPGFRVSLGDGDAAFRWGVGRVDGDRLPGCGDLHRDRCRIQHIAVHRRCLTQRVRSKRNPRKQQGAIAFSVSFGNRELGRIQQRKVDTAQRRAALGVCLHDGYGAERFAVRDILRDCLPVGIQGDRNRGVVRNIAAGCGGFHQTVGSKRQRPEAQAAVCAGVALVHQIALRIREFEVDAGKSFAGSLSLM